MRSLQYSSNKGYYGYKEFIITQTKKVKENNEFKNITLKHKIISTYSDKRAAKDKKDRDKELAKLHSKLNNIYRVCRRDAYAEPVELTGLRQAQPPY